MKSKKALIFLTFISLAVTSCSFLPARRSKKGSSNLEEDISQFYDDSSDHYVYKRAPELIRSDYDMADYLKLDNDKNVTGLNYVPDDGILFIDYPIAPRAFESIDEITTIFIGPNCNYIDEQAFSCCNNVNFVIIDSDTFPKLNHDTFCGTWDYDYFHVYVNDDIYEDVLNLETDDQLWNDQVDRLLRKKSELPSSLLSDLKFYTKATNTIIEFRVRFNDPDYSLVDYSVRLYKDGQMSASYETAMPEAGFGGLIPDTSYVVKVQYYYDLGDGSGVRTNVVSKNVKTRETIVPFLTVTKDSSKQLNIDDYGYVVGLNSNPSDGVLFINRPIRNNAFRLEKGFHTVVINQGCTFIGSNAFESCDNLRTVIINRDSMPEFVNDTFCGTWDPEDFKVYVPDERYDAMKNTITGDEYWNSDHRQRQLFKFSNLPAEKQMLTKANLNITSSSVSFDFPLYDPDGAIREVEIYLFEGDTMFAAIDRGSDSIISDRFNQLSPNTTYRLNVHLGYYLVEGGHHYFLDYDIEFTTLEA